MRVRIRSKCVIRTSHRPSDPAQSMGTLLVDKGDMRAGVPIDAVCIGDAPYAENHPIGGMCTTIKTVLKDVVVLAYYRALLACDRCSSMIGSTSVGRSEGAGEMLSRCPTNRDTIWCHVMVAWSADWRCGTRPG
jgi:hypothetical protein